MKKLKRKVKKKVQTVKKTRVIDEVKLIKFTPKSHTFQRQDGSTFIVKSLELNMQKLKVGQWYRFVTNPNEIELQ